MDELIQIIQPAPQPPPLVMSTDPLVVRDVRVQENLGSLEQQRLRYKPQIPNYLRGAVPRMGGDGCFFFLCVFVFFRLYDSFFNGPSVFSGLSLDASCFASAFSFRKKVIFDSN